MDVLKSGALLKPTIVMSGTPPPLFVGSIPTFGKEGVVVSLMKNQLCLASDPSAKKKLSINFPLNLVWFEVEDTQTLKIIVPSSLIIFRGVTDLNSWSTSFRNALNNFLHPKTHTAPRYGEWKFPSEAIYKGEWTKGTPHGKGALCYMGNVYKGVWVDGHQKGKGSCQYFNGDVYTGDFENDLPNGTGEHKTVGGDVYVGLFKGGRKQGKGTLKYANGDVFVGDFEKDTPTGKGTLTAAKGNFTYSGYFLNSLMHGEGTATQKCPNSITVTFTGEFRFGAREGYGHLCSPKEEYKGEWKNNIKHGFGSLIDHEKNQYTGQFENDLFHGKGTFIGKGGRTKYSGKWHAGRREGEGEQCYCDGSVYSGEWKSGCRHGRGSLTLPNGQMYKGQWKREQKNGHGAESYPLQEGGVLKMEGTWKKGVRDGAFTISYKKEKKKTYRPESNLDISSGGGAGGGGASGGVLGVLRKRPKSVKAERLSSINLGGGMGEETEITFKLYEVKEGGEGGGGEKGEVPSVIPPEGALSVGECMSGVIHVTYKNGQVVDHDHKWMSVSAPPQYLQLMSFV